MRERDPPNSQDYSPNCELYDIAIFYCWSLAIYSTFREDKGGHEVVSMLHHRLLLFEWGWGKIQKLSSIGRDQPTSAHCLKNCFRSSGKNLL